MDGMETPSATPVAPDVVTVYRDKSGHWRWRRVAPNGKTLSDSGEGYVRKIDCVEIAKRVNVLATIVVDDDEGGQ